MYHICVYLGQQQNHKLLHWCFIPACCHQPDLLCNLGMSSKVFSSLVMDILNDDVAPMPDPPGSLDFVFQYIDANFDGAGTISTMTNPPPIQSPSEKHCVSCSLAPNSWTDPPPIQSPLEKHCVSCSSAHNSPAWTTNNYKQNTKNDNDASALLTSDDPPIINK
jgi:hypothetical protein